MMDYTLCIYAFVGLCRTRVRSIVVTPRVITHTGLDEWYGMAYGRVIYKNPQFQQFTIALLSIPQ